MKNSNVSSGPCPKTGPMLEIPIAAAPPAAATHGGGICALVDMRAHPPQPDFVRFNSWVDARASNRRDSAGRDRPLSLGGHCVVAMAMADGNAAPSPICRDETQRCKLLYRTCEWRYQRESAKRCHTRNQYAPRLPAGRRRRQPMRRLSCHFKHPNPQVNSTARAFRRRRCAGFARMPGPRRGSRRCAARRAARPVPRRASGA